MSLTYVLQIDGPERLVKFGRTRNPSSRIATLKTGLPWPLRIVALIGADVETELKRKFKADNVRGEWFHPTLELAQWLDEQADAGRLVKQTPVDQAYVNSVIKPRIAEYLKGREPENNNGGDLVRCIFADILPTLVGREKDIVASTKGHVTEWLARGFGPTNERPVLHIDVATPDQKAAA